MRAKAGSIKPPAGFVAVPSVAVFSYRPVPPHDGLAGYRYCNVRRTVAVQVTVQAPGSR